jgi:hypothetical protein
VRCFGLGVKADERSIRPTIPGEGIYLDPRATIYDDVTYRPLGPLLLYERTYPRLLVLSVPFDYAIGEVDPGSNVAMDRDGLPVEIHKLEEARLFSRR